MCLDVKANGTAPGTLVDLWQCNGGQNQQWAIIGGCCGTAAIIGQESGFCLDSAGPPSGSGTQLVINPCTGVSTQNWVVRRMELELSSGSNHLCAAVEGSKTANGTPVIAFSCSGAFNDEWNYVNYQIYGIGTANGATTCLTAASLAMGALVELSDCTGSTTQNWAVVSGSTYGLPASYTLVVEAAIGLCLDSAGGPKTGGGTQLIINTCAATSSQNWVMR